MNQSGLKTQPAEKGKPGSLAMAAIILLLIFTVAFLAYLKSGSLDTESISLESLLSGSLFNKETKTAQELHVISYDSREQPVFGIYSDSIVKSGRDGIALLDSAGSELLTESVTLSDPLVKANTDYLLVADIGGRDYFLFKDSKLLWNGRSDMEIYNSDLDENGYVTLVTGSKRYNTEVSVIDRHGIELFRNVIANDYAVAAKVAPAGNQMAICAISTSGVQASTFIKFFDMSGVELAGVSIGEDMGIAPVLWYASDGSLFAAGDNSVTCFSDERKITWQKDFGKIYSTCIVNGDKLAVAIKDEDGTKIKMLGIKGQELGTISLENEVTSITYNDGVIGAICGREAFFLNEKGRILAEYTTKSEISGLYLFDSHKAIAVSVNSISVIDISKN